MGSLEHYVKQQDSDPEVVLELFSEIYEWIERLLRLERTLETTLLPPGPGALHSLDYLLESENETIAGYKRLLSRLDAVRPTIEIQVKVKRLIGLQPDAE